MAVNVVNLSMADLPTTTYAGTSNKIKIFQLTGSALAATDGLKLTTYDANIASVGPILSQYSAASVQTNTGYYVGVTVHPGTVGNFLLTGICTIG
jgi:hypothetical protein